MHFLQQIPKVDEKEDKNIEVHAYQYVPMYNLTISVFFKSLLNLFKTEFNFFLQASTIYLVVMEKANAM